MVFSSYEFVLGFLPLAVLGYLFFDSRLGHRTGLLFLLAASYVFYAWGEKSYLVVLVGFTALNYVIGRQTAALLRRHSRWAIWWAVGGISANLAILGFFKYTGFLIRTADQAFGLNLEDPRIALPLGISFFTFHALAYVIEVFKEGNAERSLVRFALFLGFFPHMVAGPILRPKELLPQFDLPLRSRLTADIFARGLTTFAIGLFKKSCLADSIAPFANATFSAAASGQALTVLDGWAGVLAYTMQIYFDFSGYSDMAIGAALMLGIRLPLNFDSPYKATSVIDFWRRWHMTLSRFLRDYLYFPLGGSRRGEVRRYLNLLVTMGLGGLWHGANWTFVIWGIIHGLCLGANHLWRAMRPPKGGPSSFVRTWSSRLLTFLVVVIAWVFFRAPNLETAERMLNTMFGLAAAPLFKFSAFAPYKPGLLWLAALLAIVWIMPNTQTIMEYRGLDSGRSAFMPNALSWKPKLPWALATTALLVLGILSMSSVSEFIYFHF